jgi:carbonic anhydrase/acetyltransferase-like protein (isoleucine patch superfamily)
MFPGVSIRLEAGAHIGHGAIVHGANIGKNCLVGMNAVIMDNVQLGAESIVGALSFIKAETQVPPRSLIVGNPAKIIKQVSDDMIAWKTKGTELYQKLPAQCFDSLQECTPLQKKEANRPTMAKLFDTWKQAKG